MCSCFDVNMVAERRSTVLGSLSSESVERAVQRAKSSGIEDVTRMRLSTWLTGVVMRRKMLESVKVTIEVVENGVDKTAMIGSESQTTWSSWLKPRRRRLIPTSTWT